MHRHPRIGPAVYQVSITGPLVSLVLGLAALGLEFVLPERTILNQLAFQLAWSNLIVAVFNALPGLNPPQTIISLPLHTAV